MADCIHGLDDSWCSVCLHGPTAPTAGSSFEPDGSPLAARFDAQCPACNLPISVGQQIIRTRSERYVHAGCAT